MKKKRKGPKESQAKKAAKNKFRNKPLHLPLDFEKAVEGLVNVKSQRSKQEEE